MNNPSYSRAHSSLPHSHQASPHLTKSTYPYFNPAIGHPSYPAVWTVYAPTLSAAPPPPHPASSAGGFHLFPTSFPLPPPTPVPAFFSGSPFTGLPHPRPFGGSGGGGGGGGAATAPVTPSIAVFPGLFDTTRPLKHSLDGLVCGGTGIPEITQGQVS